MADLTVAGVLERAADLIEAEGAWTQASYALDANGTSLGSGFDKDAVCYCALGALEAVQGCMFNAFGADRALAAAIVPEFRSPWTVVTLWNDAPERTQAEVVAKLREAAALARAEEAR